VEQGLVFFTSDTAETLRQGSPQNANTRQLEYGHKQFNQLFNIIVFIKFRAFNFYLDIFYFHILFLILFNH